MSDENGESEFELPSTADGWNTKQNTIPASGHGGGDYGRVRDFIRAVGQKNPGLLATSIETSMESHLMAFRAEEAPARGTLEDVGEVE